MEAEHGKQKVSRQFFGANLIDKMSCPIAPAPQGYLGNPAPACAFLVLVPRSLDRSPTWSVLVWLSFKSTGRWHPKTKR